MNGFIEGAILLILGFVLNNAFRQYMNVRSEELSLINEHIKDIERYIATAQDYWLCNPVNHEEELFFAAKVRAHHAATARVYPDIQRICNHNSTKCEKYFQELYDKSQGGTFETVGRTANFERSIELCDAGWSLIYFLRLERLNVVKVRRFFWILLSRIPFRRNSRRRPFSGLGDRFK